MTLLQHHILALALTAITTFGLGLFVFLAAPRKRLNQIFGLYSLAIAWWAFHEIFVAGGSSYKMAYLFSHSEWIGVIFIAPTFFHTIILLTGQNDRLTKYLLLIAYICSVFLLSVHLIFDIIVLPKQSVGYARYFSSLQTIGYSIPLIFFLLVHVGLWKLAQAYRTATGQRRTQLRFLFWGSLIGYVGGGADWLLVFGSYLPILNPFGIYTVPLYSIATTYAVLHHKLFEVNLVIRKSLVYSILVTLLTAGYFGLVYGVERVFQMTFGYQSRWLSLTAFALMALIFQPLKIGIQRLVDWLIFRAPQHELVRRLEKLEQEARKNEKLKAVSTLAAGLCHELRNPLQTIRTHAEFLPERYDDPEFRKRCTKVMQLEIGRIDEFLKQLMEFAKPKQAAFRQVEPHKILDSTLDLLSNEFMKRRVKLDKDYQANGLRLEADPDQLRQVVLNLIMNALEALGQNGRVTVRTGRENGWFTLKISDTGPGISPEILPRLFEPFITTKPDGNGLGLSIVHSIVREHRGTISVQSQQEQGTIFVVKIPALS